MSASRAGGYAGILQYEAQFRQFEHILILLHFVGTALLCRFQSTWISAVEVQVARLRFRRCRPYCQVDNHSLDLARFFVCKHADQFLMLKMHARPTTVDRRQEMHRRLVNAASRRYGGAYYRNSVRCQLDVDLLALRFRGLQIGTQKIDIGKLP